ncbi:MAG: HNH endonuclease signature motif containing protein [Acidobacteria bacterium]|nr:HNH endonuclease signature motif containing protein [Acidobacteriota bacterium]
MAKNTSSQLYLSANGLTTSRRWTKAMIRDLLDEPDETVPNPRYRGTANMQLYELERVIAAEKHEAFKSRMEVAQQRRAQAKASRPEPPTGQRRKRATKRQPTTFFGPDGRVVTQRQGKKGKRSRTDADREARKKGRVPDGVRKHVRARARDRCTYCGRANEGQTRPRFNVDHVVPRAAGGKSTKANLVWSCVPCNTRKAALSVEEFLKDDPDRLAQVLAQLAGEDDTDKAMGPQPAPAKPAQQEQAADNGHDDARAMALPASPPPGVPADRSASDGAAADQKTPEFPAKPQDRQDSAMPRQKRKRKKQPAPCASCQDVTTELVPHKEMRDGVVIRERICHGCYFRALKSAITDGDMSWARLNNEVHAVLDTIREQEAQEAANAWRSDPATEKQIAFIKSLAADRRQKIELAHNLTKGEASNLIDAVRSQEIPRTCPCGVEFTISPDSPPNRKYCDTCIRLTPAQRRKRVPAANTTVH